MSDSTAPIVSVIIPVFNAERFLEITIKSVLEQTIKEIEILVVDDGSSDASSGIIDNLLKQDHRIKKISQKNKGVSSARNLGFKYSHGDYIAFLDADDVWLPDNLEIKLNKFRQGEFGMVHSNASIIDTEGEVTGEILSGCEGNLLKGLLSWKATQIPGPSSILISRSAMEVVGLFDEQLSTSADMDFFIRIATHYTIGHVDKVTWHYRVHNENMHKNIALMQHDMELVFKKAGQARLFNSQLFERQCFANMYMTLAASWRGDGGNWLKALSCALKSFVYYPPMIFQLPGRIIK